MPPRLLGLVSVSFSRTTHGRSVVILSARAKELRSPGEEPKLRGPGVRDLKEGEGGPLDPPPPHKQQTSMRFIQAQETT